MPGSAPERVPPPGITPGAAGPAETQFSNRGCLYVLAMPLVVGGVTVPTVLLLSRFHHKVNPAVALTIGLAMFPAFFAWAAAMGFMRRRARRRDAAEIERRGFRVCLKCHYSLELLDAEGVCPECGTSYSAANLADSWRWTYANDPQGPTNQVT